jgi:hypothetical protein
MKVVKKFDIDTSKYRFNLTISERPKGGFVGEYIGFTPKAGQLVSPGAKVPEMKSVGPEKLIGDDINKLIEACRTEIEKIDGKIQHTTELDFLR